MCNCLLPLVQSGETTIRVNGPVCNFTRFDCPNWDKSSRPFYNLPKEIKESIEAQVKVNIMELLNV